MKDRQLYEVHAEICRTLTHPVRLEILDLLRRQEMNVSYLVEALELPQGTVSRHLSSMRSKGVLVTRREGTSVYYRLSSQRIVNAYDQMHKFAMERLAQQTEVLAE